MILDKERIILLAEEKIYSLLDKDYSEWTEEDRINGRDKLHVYEELIHKKDE